MAYESKYSEIIIDKSNNTPNNQQISLTVEQYYDLLHHTHSAEDLVTEKGSVKATLEEMNTQINDLQQAVVDLTNERIIIDDLDSESSDEDSDGNTIPQGFGITEL
jgi:hypothetical protein